jgi:hypothetical protein
VQDVSRPVDAVARGRRWGRQLGRVDWLLLTMFITLEFADIVTTNHALAFGGAFEANPIMSAIQNHLGCLWWAPKVLAVAWVAVAVMRIRRQWPLVLVNWCAAIVVMINLASR